MWPFGCLNSIGNIMGCFVTRRGIAYIDVKKIKYITEMRRDYEEKQLKEADFKANLRKYIDKMFRNRLEIVSKEVYKNTDAFLAEFDKQGGVIEACPTERLSSIKGSIAVTFEIEPDGEINVLGNYEKINVDYFRNVAAVSKQQLVKDLVDL